jgi:hypothetical protein
MISIYALAISLLLFAVPVAAQTDKDERREERKEQQEYKKNANKDRVDYTVFRRQILALPEFAEERKKLAELRKKTSSVPKIFAVVDSANDNENATTLLGYITETLGDASANIYEITYDRTAKKIVKVKPTGEKLEQEEADEKPVRKAPAKAANAPKKKKNSDEDEENEDEENEEPEEPAEKPTKPVKNKRTNDEE